MQVDGNTASWGLSHKLTTNSIIIWIKSQYKFREHYYTYLNEYEHYIPVDEDLSNLDSISNYFIEKKYKKNDYIDPLNIIKRVNKLLNKRIRPDDCYCYIYRLLYSLSKLQHEIPTNELLKENGFDINKFTEFIHPVEYNE